MEIIIITGQQNGNLHLAGEYEHVKYFPEEKTLHPYNLKRFWNYVIGILRQIKI